MTPAAVLLTLVSLGRLGELWWARRNTAALLARGAVEIAPDHYALIVAIHTAWLGALWYSGSGQPVNSVWLALFAGLQVARVWVLTTMGTRWTTRIIVVPGESLVARGPYRFFNHPNYLVVVGEIAVLPMCLGLPWAAVVFSALNAAVLTLRIRAENAGLRPSSCNAAARGRA